MGEKGGAIGDKDGVMGDKGGAMGDKGSVGDMGDKGGAIGDKVHSLIGLQHSCALSGKKSSSDASWQAISQSPSLSILEESSSFVLCTT